MISRRVLVATVVFLSAAATAQADIVLGFRVPNTPPATTSSPIPNDYTVANTSPVSVLVMDPFDTKYVVMTLTVTPTNAGPAQNFWNTMNGGGGWNQMATFGMNMTFNSALVNNPYIPLPASGATLTENFSNLRIQNAGQGYAVSYPGDPFSAGYRQILGVSTAGLTLDGTNALAETPIAAFKVTTSGPFTPTFMTFTKLTLGPGGPLQNVWQVTNGLSNQFLDNEVFGGAHPQFQLQIVPIPEPSTMALGGVALLGLAFRTYRKRRAVLK